MAVAQVHALDLLKPFSRLFGGDDGVLIWKGPGQFVKIVDQDWDHGHTRPPANSHPTQIKPEDLAVILASIDAPDPQGTAIVPVFTRREIQTLAEKLSVALDRSQPDQDVVFGAADNHENMASSSLRSSGCRVFLQGGRLNMIFGDVLQSEGSFSSNTSQFSKPNRAGRRIDSNGRDIRVATGPGIVYWQGRGIVREDWILIDMPTVIAAYLGMRPRNKTNTAFVTPQQQPPVAGDSLSGENRRLREELARARQNMSGEQQNDISSSSEEAPVTSGTVDAMLQQQAPVADGSLSAENRRLREELARARQRMSEEQQNNISSSSGVAPVTAGSADAKLQQQTPVADGSLSAENRKLREELARARQRMSGEQRNNAADSYGETRVATAAAAAPVMAGNSGNTVTSRESGAEAIGASGDIVQRLTTLKTLYDKKLITSAEYDAKRKEILEKF